jgi:hypothetical protein
VGIEFILRERQAIGVHGPCPVNGCDER